VTLLLDVVARLRPAEWCKSGVILGVLFGDVVVRATAEQAFGRGSGAGRVGNGAQIDAQRL
jgi:hypothetical protein